MAHLLIDNIVHVGLVGFAEGEAIVVTDMIDSDPSTTPMVANPCLHSKTSH